MSFRGKYDFCDEGIRGEYFDRLHLRILGIWTFNRSVVENFSRIFFLRFSLSEGRWNERIAALLADLNDGPVEDWGPFGAVRGLDFGGSENMLRNLLSGFLVCKSTLEDTRSGSGLFRALMGQI